VNSDREPTIESLWCIGISACLNTRDITSEWVVITPLFSENFKTCQANAFHLNRDRKFLNHLIGCISWHAYFLFLSPRSIMVLKKI
jgi:hypothetical protein